MSDPNGTAQPPITAQPPSTRTVAAPAEAFPDTGHGSTDTELTDAVLTDAMLTDRVLTDAVLTPHQQQLFDLLDEKMRQLQEQVQQLQDELQLWEIGQRCLPTVEDDPYIPGWDVIVATVRRVHDMDHADGWAVCHHPVCRVVGRFA